MVSTSMLEQEHEITQRLGRDHDIWERIAPGLWAANVSRFSRDRDEDVRPEFAIVRLSAEGFAEFARDRKSVV